MATPYQRKPKSKIILARKAILDLFKEADKAFDKDPELSKKYISDIRKTAMKFKIRLTSEQKRSFCKNCGNYLKQGRNTRVRITDKTITYTCLSCGEHSRIGKK